MDLEDLSFFTNNQLAVECQMGENSAASATTGTISLP